MRLGFGDSEIRRFGAEIRCRDLAPFALYSKSTGRMFDLYVRGNARLSAPLSSSIRSDGIVVKFVK